MNPENKSFKTSTITYLLTIENKINLNLNGIFSQLKEKLFPDGNRKEIKHSKLVDFYNEKNKIVYIYKCVENENDEEENIKFNEKKKNRIEEWYGVRRLKNSRFSLEEKKKKKRNNFINQITITISRGDGKKTNLMIFKNGKIKIAGCQCVNDALKSFEMFWKNISNNDDVVDSNEEVVISLNDVMINVSFENENNINKIRLNEFLNTPKFENICTSFYEPSSQQAINVQLFYPSYSTKSIERFLFSKEKKIEKISNAIVFIKEKKRKTSLMIFDTRIVMSSVDYILLKQSLDFLIEMINTSITSF